MVLYGALPCGLGKTSVQWAMLVGLLYATVVLSGCWGFCCSVGVPSGARVSLCGAELYGCSPVLPAQGVSFYSDETPSGIPPIACSLGRRPSHGPILDETVCASAYRAKMCKPVLAVIAGPLSSVQERRCGGPQEPARRSRHEARGELSPPWLPVAPRCVSSHLCHLTCAVGRSPGAGNFDVSSWSFPGGPCRSLVGVDEWFPGLP